MPPLTVDSRTSAFTVAGRRSVTAPLTVVNFPPFAHTARSIVALIDPFTVVARADPVVDRFTEPLTVVPSVSLCRPSAVIDPFTVRANRPMPAGTWTLKSTRVSLSRLLLRPRPPGRHSFGWPSADG